ncbi:hypothetical protein QYF61_022943 [Mycteria americana]|uniref:G-protein coupled receptors family 1 profile domain-containing protein n=1 Tax=Mycteria americana TaxID=33587 RepID=A0AAN7MIY6_MYCAM|nr:hypothetical protein QYF61_022943 [Mycteria americana]
MHMAIFMFSTTAPYGIPRNAQALLLKVALIHFRTNPALMYGVVLPPNVENQKIRSSEGEDPFSLENFLSHLVETALEILVDTRLPVSQQHALVGNKANDLQELQLLHLWLFPGIYLAALLGNGLSITAVACDRCLHTPMYFFHFNLSFLGLGSVSTTVPISMANSLWHTRDISYAGCTAQVFLFAFLMSAEVSLLTIMAYDRYMPSPTPCAMGPSRTAELAAKRQQLPGTIFMAALRLPCEQGRHKAFSTWLPHLTVVSLFASSAMFAYLKPPSISSPSLNLVVAVLYSVVPPTVNALIYSTGTKELKDALRKVI